MRTNPITPSNIGSRLETIEKRLEALRFPHFTDSSRPLSGGQAAVAYGGATNTYYVLSLSAGYRETQVAATMNGRYLRNTFSVISEDLGFGWSGIATTQIRYHQVRPRVYSDSQIASELNYVVIDERSFTVTNSSPVVGQNLIDLQTDFPEILGTYGYLSRWVKIDTAIAINWGYVSVATSHLLLSEWLSDYASEY